MIDRAICGQDGRCAASGVESVTGRDDVRRGEDLGVAAAIVQVIARRRQCRDVMM